MRCVGGHKGSPPIQHHLQHLPQDAEQGLLLLLFNLPPSSSLPSFPPLFPPVSLISRCMPSFFPPTRQLIILFCWARSNPGRTFVLLECLSQALRGLSSSSVAGISLTSNIHPSVFIQSIFQAFVLHLQGRDTTELL